MDIVRKYFDNVIKGIEDTYKKEKDSLEAISELFYSHMVNDGLVQLFGVKEGREFAIELNYRAGGLAAFHELKFSDLVLHGLCDKKDLDNGTVYDDISYVKRFYDFYEIDDRDMFVLISEKGNEPLIIEMAKEAKRRKMTVVSVVNQKSYDACGGLLNDYADLVLDMGASYPDVSITIENIETGSLRNNISNSIAQMLMAETYSLYIRDGKEAPILLSNNTTGAKEHNSSLLEGYGKRL